MKKRAATDSKRGCGAKTGKPLGAACVRMVDNAIREGRCERTKNDRRVCRVLKGKRKPAAIAGKPKSESKSVKENKPMPERKSRSKSPSKSKSKSASKSKSKSKSPNESKSKTASRSPLSSIPPCQFDRNLIMRVLDSRRSALLGVSVADIFTEVVPLLKRWKFIGKTPDCSMSRSERELLKTVINEWNADPMQKSKNHLINILIHRQQYSPFPTERNILMYAVKLYHEFVTISKKPRFNPSHIWPKVTDEKERSRLGTEFYALQDPNDVFRKPVEVGEEFWNMYEKVRIYLMQCYEVYDVRPNETWFHFSLMVHPAKERLGPFSEGTKEDWSHWRLQFTCDVVGTSKLVKEVEKTGKYDALPPALIFIDMGSARGGHFIYEFHNTAVTHRSVYESLDEDGKAFVKGLAYESLCYVMRYLLAEKFVRLSTEIGLHAYGDSIHQSDMSKLVGFYQSAGFNVSGSMVRGQTPMTADVNGILSACKTKKKFRLEQDKTPVSIVNYFKLAGLPNAEPKKL